MSMAHVLANALRCAGSARAGGEEAARRVVIGGSQISTLTRSQWPVAHNNNKTFSSPASPRRIHTSRPREGFPKAATGTEKANTTAATAPSWRAEPPRPPSAAAAPNPGEELTEQLRGVMRRLAHSVVVCTAADGAGRPRGMTMSSFVSLSMDPVPLVTFNVRTPSRTLRALEEAGGVFNVHVLAEGPEGARVAEWFTRGNAGRSSGGKEGEEAEGVEALFGRGMPGGLEVVEEDGAAPVLRGRGVLFVLRCRVLGQGLVRVRDHVVVVGEVEGVVAGEGEGFGLVYADRRYRMLGDVLVTAEE